MLSFRPKGEILQTSKADISWIAERFRPSVEMTIASGSYVVNFEIGFSQLRVGWVWCPVFRQRCRMRSTLTPTLGNCSLRCSTSCIHAPRQGFRGIAVVSLRERELEQECRCWAGLGLQNPQPPCVCSRRHLSRDDYHDWSDHHQPSDRHESPLIGV